MKTEKRVIHRVVLLLPGSICRHAMLMIMTMVEDAMASIVAMTDRLKGRGLHIRTTRGPVAMDDQNAPSRDVKKKGKRFCKGGFACSKKACHSLCI